MSEKYLVSDIFRALNSKLEPFDELDLSFKLASSECSPYISITCSGERECISYPIMEYVFEFTNQYGLKFFIDTNLTNRPRVVIYF